MPKPVLVTTEAVEFIRNMGGGTRSKLMRCSNGGYYVVKFQNNPQGITTLANDLLGTLTAQSMGLPVAEPAVVLVGEDLSERLHGGLFFSFGNRHPRCAPGLCFGSRWPASTPMSHGIYDFPPSGRIDDITNLSDFLGTLVFDKWTGNTDHRGVIYVRDHTAPDGRAHRGCRMLMIDQGHCFNGAAWNFPDFSKNGILHGAYDTVTGIGSFEPWLDQLEKEMKLSTLQELADEIPRGWYERDSEGLTRLLTELFKRRSKVRTLLAETRLRHPRSFPLWKEEPQRLAAAACRIGLARLRY